MIIATTYRVSTQISESQKTAERENFLVHRIATLERYEGSIPDATYRRMMAELLASK